MGNYIHSGQPYMSLPVDNSICPYVVSMIGLKKKTCTWMCADDECNRAHPNSSGSVVLHPKYCLRGSIYICELGGCPFNHFRTEEQFVRYRSRDTHWVETHPDLVEKYNTDRSIIYFGYFT